MEKYLVLLLWAYLMPLNIIRLIGHLFIRFFRRLGIASVFVYMIFWLACFLVVFSNGHLFLKDIMFTSCISLQIIGGAFFLLGVFLQVLAVRFIGLKTLVGIPEIVPAQHKVPLTVKGPFSLVRHPVYLGQLLCILGAFLFTWQLSLAILFVMAFILFWPVAMLEERELIERFGEEYKNYRKCVPMIFPTFRLQKKL